MTPTEKAFPVSWEQFHRDCRALAWRLSDLGREWKGLVTITRGGLVPSAIIARELGIRTIETVCISSYEYQERKELKVLKGITEPLLEDGGRDILIVDELTDTGKTGKIVRNMLPNAYFATVYAKPAGREMVDSYITEVSQDTWIYFPWDLGYSYQEPLAGAKAR